MPQIHIRKIIYAIRHRYWTFNNIVIAVAFLIAASWVWGSLQVMQRNFSLQREVDQKARQLQLTELQTESLELQQRYYQTDEYRELAARESLGLVMPGESVVILPDNSQAALDADREVSTVTPAAARPTESNIEQWLNFLFGGYSRNMNNNDN
jgi:cell division protein FtsB